ncbi:MAG: hypothetical protein JRM75_02560 [Nitrososphaerota archaeon]|nr:hypothetical protein [Nitrososphaerota archaeon]
MGVPIERERDGRSVPGKRAGEKYDCDCDEGVDAIMMAGALTPVPCRAGCSAVGCGFRGGMIVPGVSLAGRETGGEGGGRGEAMSAGTSMSKPKMEMT